MSLAATPALVRLPVWRARFVLALFLLGFALVAGRSGYLQAIRTAFLQEKGEARYARVIDVPATRGRILDRNGEALAISTPVKSVWAMPEALEADRRQRAALARVLGMPLATLEDKLAEGAGRDFVYLKRQVPPETARQVVELKLPGVFEHHEFRRYYPGGEVTAHVVGFTGVDDVGQEGMELAYQARLAGAAGSRRVIKDRHGGIVENIGAIQAALDGQDLVLSIDGKIQTLAYGALKAAVRRHRAKAGAAIVLDVLSGEILALVNVPSYNPNNRAGLAGAQLRNRALTDAFEPGSTLKPLTIALALETGKATPRTVIDTEGGKMTIASYTIRDSHAARAMSVTQILQVSSNIGAAKLALSLPSEAMWDLYRRVGLGSPPALGFPGETAGRLRHYSSWRPVEQATMAYGHGVSVSLVQLARAYTVFARDGELVPLSLLRSAGVADGVKVLSAETARAVRSMLEAAVQPAGTGPHARIAGWRVAGKTGTSHKLVDGSYAPDKYLSSFVGLAPVSAPRLVAAVFIDEPSAGEHYGGVVAAPVFAQVMRGALRLLGIPLDAPPEPLELPGETDHAREST
ncbi:MAG: cell division protein [Betaproteobacteria bacterium SG8_39]|nr:MAG: cell division protein [Betaproteobacteria bacterium SG8_39]